MFTCLTNHVFGFLLVCFMYVLLSNSSNACIMYQQATSSSLSRASSASRRVTCLQVCWATTEVVMTKADNAALR
jgi:hypothetical protein